MEFGSKIITPFPFSNFWYSWGINTGFIKSLHYNNNKNPDLENICSQIGFSSKLNFLLFAEIWFVMAFFFLHIWARSIKSFCCFVIDSFFKHISTDMSFGRQIVFFLPDGWEICFLAKIIKRTSSTGQGLVRCDSSPHIIWGFPQRDAHPPHEKLPLGLLCITSTALRTDAKKELMLLAGSTVVSRLQPASMKPAGLGCTVPDLMVLYWVQAPTDLGITRQ